VNFYLTSFCKEDKILLKSNKPNLDIRLFDEKFENEFSKDDSYTSNLFEGYKLNMISNHLAKNNSNIEEEQNLFIYRKRKKNRLRSLSRKNTEKSEFENFNIEENIIYFDYNAEMKYKELENLKEKSILVADQSKYSVIKKKEESKTNGNLKKKNYKSIIGKNIKKKLLNKNIKKLDDHLDQLKKQKNKTIDLNYTLKNTVINHPLVKVNNKEKNPVFHIKKETLYNYNNEDIIKVENEVMHFCVMCSKRYKNYSALYAHRRNKHNIIHIKGTENIFVSIKNKNKDWKINYNAIAPRKKIKIKITEKLISFTKENLELLYKKHSESSLFNPNMVINEHPFILSLKRFQKIFSINLMFFYRPDYHKLKTNEKFYSLKNKFFDLYPKYFEQFKDFSYLNDHKNFNESEFLNIDDIFAIYFILLGRVIKGFPNIYIKEINKFFLLFREFLNTFGWEFIEKYRKFKLEFYEYKNNKEFTQYNFIRYIPDFVENFYSIFLNIENFGLVFEMCFYKGILLNFCKYILNCGFTSLKIEDLKE